MNCSSFIVPRSSFAVGVWCQWLACRSPKPKVRVRVLVPLLNSRGEEQRPVAEQEDDEFEGMHTDAAEAELEPGAEGESETAAEAAGDPAAARAARRADPRGGG